MLVATPGERLQPCAGRPLLFPDPGDFVLEAVLLGEVDLGTWAWGWCTGRWGGLGILLSLSGFVSFSLLITVCSGACNRG